MKLQRHKYKGNHHINITCSHCGGMVTTLIYNDAEMRVPKEELVAKIKGYMETFDYKYCRKCGKKLYETE